MMSYNGPEEDREERETQQEWEDLQSDPYSDDEKDQMGSSEYYNSYD
jgi:hypothetical protein